MEIPSNDNPVSRSIVTRRQWRSDRGASGLQGGLAQGAENSLGGLKYTKYLGSIVFFK